ncbi:hypothetical protein NDA01_31175 [Trichocoleus desertorum AS-A10]|uniref:hypothetical protein n=1 Tax=Trichocoleus desertorum TaxID=1481672 RepID=UPI00329A45D2
MQRACYAGASMMLNLAKGVGEDDVSQAARVVAIEALEREGQEFWPRIGIDYSGHCTS